MSRRFLVLSGLVLIMLTQTMMGTISSEFEELKSYVLEKIEARMDQMIKVSDALWDYAEIALLEHQSSKLLADIAESEGFKVERGVADLETAFVAIYGSGKPVIGILAEYDALPGLSQENITFKKAIIENGGGHGCGHNLFGAGSLGAALVLKELILEGKLTGTIKLYGCPAEEDVGGKLYMAREGLFDDLDACLAWHPSYETSVDVTGSQAMDDLYIEFFGKASHAAFDPWQGRSALDALEMATFGINLLREHVKPSVRIHYVVLEGGNVPNIVPEYSKLWLWVRDSTRLGVKIVLSRIENIVAGSSMATETTSKIENLGSYHEMLVNVTGSKVMQKNLEWIGSIEYTPEEMEFAKKLQKETQVVEKGMISDINELEDPNKEPEGGSTDVAEVSWIIPTLHISTTCAPFEIPWHSWAVVTSSKHSVGYKGMLLAAKVLAATAVDLFKDSNILVQMKKEFDTSRNGYVYKSGIPKDRKPPKRVK